MRLQSIGERILVWGTMLLVGVTPLVYWGSRYIPHITSKTFFFMGMLEVLFCIWVYIVWSDISYRIPKKPQLVLLPLIAYTIWLSISASVSGAPGLAFWSSFGRGTGLIISYHLLALTVIITSVAYRHGWVYVERLLLSFFSAGVLLAVSVWLSSGGFNIALDIFSKSQGGGLAGNSSLAGSYLLWVIFVGCLLLVRMRSTSIRRYILIGLCIVLCAPILLNWYGVVQGLSLIGTARGALLGLVLGFVCMLGVYMAYSHNVWRRFVGRVTLVVLIGMSVAGWAVLVNQNTRLHSWFVQVASDSRFVFWDIAKKGIADKPVFGWGSEQYSIVRDRYFDTRIFHVGEDAPVELWNDRAHNIFYENALAGGIPAVVFYILFFCSIWYGIYRAVQNGTMTTLEASVISGAVFGYIIQNLLVFDSVLSLLSLYTIAGVVYGISAFDAHKTSSIRKKVPIQYVVVLVVMCVFVWIVCVLLPSQKTKYLARLLQVPVADRVDLYDKLKNTSRSGDARDIGSVTEVIYQQYYNNQQLFSNSENIPIIRSDIDALLGYVQPIANRNDHDYRLLLQISLLLGLRARVSVDDGSLYHRESIVYAQRASAVSPQNPYGYWILSKAQYVSGQKYQAQKTLEYAISLDPTIPYSHELLIALAKQTNNTPLLAEVISNAQRHIPGFVLQ
jgi:O-antigen ligase